MDPQVRRPGGGVRFPPPSKGPEKRKPSSFLIRGHHQMETNNGADSSDDDDNDDEHMYESSPRHKKYYSPVGPHTLARRSNMLLYFALAWMTLITVFLVIHTLRGGGVSQPLTPVLEVKKEPSKWHVPFNLVPDNGTNGRLMTMDVRQMNFAQLLRYDVCCQQGHYYVCRTVSKNLGIECYLTSESKAVMHINHPDMVGARCTLMWIEKRE